jgi:hypothetical protein
MTMTIISSQRYLDRDTVETKKQQLVSVDSVTITIVDIQYNDMYVLADGHHTLVAATELGIAVSYQIVQDAERLIGVDYLDARRIDSDYYDVTTGLDIDF